MFLEAEELNVSWKSQRRLGAGHGIWSPDSYLVTEEDNGSNCGFLGDEKPIFGVFQIILHPLYEILKKMTAA